MPPQINFYLNSPILNFFFTFLKILFIILSSFFIVFIIFGLFRTLWLRRLFLWDFQEFVTYRPFGVKKIARQWQKIQTRLNTGLESEFKLAIIEAESILDDILKRMGFAGAGLGERLEKLTAATLPNIDEISEAHKIRNNIVHDPDYRLGLDEAKKTLAVYEKALVDLQAL